MFECCKEPSKDLAALMEREIKVLTENTLEKLEGITKEEFTELVFLSAKDMKNIKNE